MLLMANFTSMKSHCSKVKVQLTLEPRAVCYVKINLLRTKLINKGLSYVSKSSFENLG